MSNIIIEKENRFLIQFDYSRRLSQAVVKLPGVEYNPKYRRWECPITSAAGVFAFGAKYGFILPEKKSRRSVFSEPVTQLPDLKEEIDLKMQLFPYQRNGVAYALEKGSCIIGDAPGLGKTAQAIAAVCARDLFPCLVICPASLKYNWLMEWKLWTGRHDPAILTDTIKNTWSVFHQMGMHDVFITNYESLKKYFVVQINTPKGQRFKLEHIRFHPNIKLFKSVIIDESHKAKDPSTMQSKLCYGLTRDRELVLLLTGTPIVNRPIDLLSQILMSGKMHHFGTIANFREMCADDERWPEINTILRNHCYYRREKQEVLKDLPDKYRQKVYCDIDNRDEYNAALADLAGYLADYRQATDEKIMRSMRAEIIVRIGVLKNISARGKLNDVKEYIDNIVEQGEKIVVFIFLKEVAAKLRERYPDALFFTGGQSEDERNRAIDDFQKCDECGVRFERHTDCDHEFVPSEHKIIFVNYKAGGVGITLTASSNVSFIEFPWHPADVEQGESRCHRISQKNAVQSLFFIGRNTIDEQIMQIIEDKREMAEACTGAVDNTEERIIHSITELLGHA
ncbi:MAG: DEAD/DEAH box helicase [Bacteroidales bacterium]|jgi:SWI/SNF-related matrix-associated actin-dependent regulator 1 of chromatin subfamily A|nr:DEAD/DEAH box helicase [Bacteroidales bacterium]